MKHRLVIIIIIILLVLIIWVLYEQNKPEPAPPHDANNSHNEDSTQITELPVNEDGLFMVIIPQNLFGGENKTAEDIANSYLSNPNHDRILTNVIPNSDGSVTMLLTLGQLTAFKENCYITSQFHITYDVESIIEVIIEDILFVEVTVLVNRILFINNEFERLMCSIVLFNNAGTYQVLSGVPPDEWHTTITIKDVDTGEIIRQTYYPNDDMYKVY